MPHKSVNEPLSNGFVKFRIKLKPEIAQGTIVSNHASIFFDYNQPIVTNTTTSMVKDITHSDLSKGEGIVLSSTLTGLVKAKKHKVNVSPNPFSGKTTFELNESQNMQSFKLFDNTGRLVKATNLAGSTYIFERENLQNGIYIYCIISEDGQLMSGKISIE